MAKAKMKPAKADPHPKTLQRFESALRKALSTPPVQHKKKSKRKAGAKNI